MENRVTTQIEEQRSRRRPIGTIAIVALTIALIAVDLLVPESRSLHPVLAVASHGLCCLLALFIFSGLRFGIARHCEQCDRQEGPSRFREFMDRYPLVAFLKDVAGRIVYVNDAYCKAFGIQAEQRLGKLDAEIMPRAVAEQLCANDRQAMESKCGLQFEEAVPDRSGTLRNWLTFKFPVLGRAGEVFLGGIAIETTDTVRAQNALRESEARYRQIVEYAGDIIVRCDSGGRVTYVNEMGARILKISCRQLCGRRALWLVHPDARRRARSTMWRELRQGATDLYVEIPVIAGDGSEIWLGQTIRVLRSGDTIKEFQAICRDITHRRKMEAELRASEERFRMLYENGPVAYHEIDSNGVIQRVNRAECEMLGYTEAELVGRSVLDLVVPEEREISCTALPAKIREELPLRPFNRIYLRPDGRRVRLEIHENLLRDTSGAVIGIRSVLLDVTQRHLAEMLNRDRWRVSEMMAQQQPLDRVLLTIAAMIGHQDETLLCIPVKLLEQRLEPVCTADSLQPLCDAIGRLGSEAFSIWPVDRFEVGTLHFANPAGTADFGEVAEAGRRLGIKSCWSIPIVSSSHEPLGLLLTFSPRDAEPGPQEHEMLEAASRISSLAIEHRHLTDLLAFQASHDSLTGLPNRSTFEARLEDALAHANQHGTQLALFYVDLDRFKEVNDKFGHSSGDDLLRQVATRLRRCIRRTDSLARIGGDEFSVLLAAIEDPSEANRIAEGILRAFHAPFEIAGRKIQVTASIGISFYPTDGLDAPTLQRNSDTAMYRIKNTGKNSFGCYGLPQKISA